MIKITLEDAQARLPELIDGLAPGEQVAIVRGDQVVARLTGGTPPDPISARVPGFALPKAGSERSDKFWMSHDFDEPLEDFREYME